MASDNLALTSGKQENVKLEKSLGLHNGVAIIVGLMIGSGIFVSPKGVLMETQSVGGALMIWALCGVICLTGAICYAELGTCITKSGSDYAYIQEAFGPLPSFLFLWVSVIVMLPVGVTIAALTFAYYVLQPIFSTCDPPDNAVKLLAASAIAFLTFTNCASVKISNMVQNVFTVAKVAALLMVIIIGIIQLCRGKTENLENAFEGTTKQPGAFALAFYSGLYSYSGWSYLNYVTEELKNPSRNLPMAICISVPLVTGIYTLANVAYLTVLTPAQLLASNAVAVTFADRAMGVMAWTMPLCVAASTFGSCNGLIFTCARLCFVGARNGHMPDALAQINVKLITPITAIAFEGVVSMLLLATSDVYFLINLGSFIETLFMGVSVAGLLYLRYKQPNMERPIKVNLVFPIVFLGVVAFLVIIPLFYSPVECGLGVAMTLTGIPVYIIGVKWTKKPLSIQRWINSFTRNTQKIFYSIKEDLKDD